MPGTPFILGITVYDTDGSTAKSDVTVLLRNESTNDTQTKTSNASGEVVFNLADFSSGWTVGDIVTYFVFYSGYEASGSFTTTDTGGTTKTMTLVAVPSSASLRYFTVQEFYDYFQLVSYDSDNENGVKAQTVIKVGQAIEDEIDNKLKLKFDDNSGSYYLVTQEYHNADGAQSKWPGDDPNISSQNFFFTKKKPIVSLTTFQVNLAGPDQTPDWTTVTTTDYDLKLKEEIGRIEIVDSSKFPAAGKDQVRITYTYGMSSVPNDIKRLAILMTGQAFASNQLTRLHIDATEARALQEIGNFVDTKKQIAGIMEDWIFSEVRTI